MNTKKTAIISIVLIMFFSLFVFAQNIPNHTLTYQDVARWFYHPLNNSPTSAAVSCATTATAIPATSLAGRRALSVYNNDSVLIYIGGSNVSTTNGMPLDVDAQMTFNVGDNVILYCIVAASTANLRILELK